MDILYRVDLDLSASSEARICGVTRLHATLEDARREIAIHESVLSLQIIEVPSEAVASDFIAFRDMSDFDDADLETFLSDDRDLDELLAEDRDDELLPPEGPGEKYRWASQGLDELVRNCPEAAWPIIIRLVTASPSDEILAIVAAGPLESLLCGHGEAFVDRVVAASKGDSRFRKCLRAVWGQSSMASAVRARIDEEVKDFPNW